MAWLVALGSAGVGIASRPVALDRLEKIFDGADTTPLLADLALAALEDGTWPQLARDLFDVTDDDLACFADWFGREQVLADFGNVLRKVAATGYALKVSTGIADDWCALSRLDDEDRTVHVQLVRPA